MQTTTAHTVTTVTWSALTRWQQHTARTVYQRNRRTILGMTMAQTQQRFGAHVAAYREYIASLDTRPVNHYAH